jgi:glycosyltransferase involved in cell wall biosynthesis
MKILIPMIGFGSAGGYRVLSQLANYWQRAGHQVAFLVDYRTTAPYFPTVGKILRFGRDGSILDGDAGQGQEDFAAQGNAVSILLGMARALQRIGADYDVILANHSLTAFPVWLARTRAAKKFYYVQAYEPEYYGLEPGIKSRILKFLSTLSYRLPLRQVANAPIYIGYRQIRATVWVPPGIDAATFHERSARPLLAPETTIGVIGRHELTKGTRYVLEAFEQLAQSDPHIRLRVAFGNLPAGWHHERAEVVVPASDEELADFYRSIDIMIAPGTVQLGACHYPVLEAMATGTPVVTTGYLPADRTNAWIVPVKDSRAIADAVRSIQATPAPKIEERTERARADVAAFYWEAVADQFSRHLSS